MKTTFAALALSLLGTTLAAPAPQTTEPNPYPVSISNISLKHLIESDGYDLTFYATTRSPSGDALQTTTCHTGFNKGGPYPDASNPAACANNLHFYFPTGVDNVESWELTVSVPSGDASGLIAAGPRYQCGPYEGTIGNIDTECKSTNGGEFYLKV